VARELEWLTLEDGQLRGLRAAQGLSQEGIAALIPVATRTWSRWEKQDRIPFHLAPTIGKLLSVELAPPPKVSNEEAIATALQWLGHLDPKLQTYLGGLRSASLPRRQALADLLSADATVRRGFARFLLADYLELKATVAALETLEDEPAAPSLDERLDEIFAAIDIPRPLTLSHAAGTPDRLAELEALADVQMKLAALLLLAVGTLTAGSRTVDVDAALEVIQRKLGQPLRIVRSEGSG
jgi:hypothetical protein